MVRIAALATSLALAVGIGVGTTKAEDRPRTSDKSDKKELSTAEIKRRLIAESIAEYPGNCPCPYSRARNGSRCGRRSAYSRQEGYAPLCYPRDVTPEMVEAYRRRAHGD